jgi:hypothetical protein
VGCAVGCATPTSIHGNYCHGNYFVRLIPRRRAANLAPCSRIEDVGANPWTNGTPMVTASAQLARPSRSISTCSSPLASSRLAAKDGTSSTTCTRPRSSRSSTAGTAHQRHLCPRRRPGQSARLLHRRPRLPEEDRRPSGGHLVRIDGTALQGWLERFATSTNAGPSLDHAGAVDGPIDGPAQRRAKKKRP